MIEEFTDLLDLVKNQCLLTASNELSFNLNNNFRFSLAQSINFKPESFFPFYLWICQIFKEYMGFSIVHLKFEYINIMKKLLQM